MNRTILSALLIICALLAALPVSADDAPVLPDNPLRMSTRTLANGLQVVVVENPSVPLATVEIGVHNGSMNEPLPLNGLSHLYEHMFFKGNAVYPDQIAYMAQMRAMGGVFNGTTDKERVDYFITTGSGELPKAMEFMSYAIKSPRFDPQELTREKAVVLGEFDRNEANPDYFLNHAVTYALFYKYPTYKDPLGTRSSIKAATVAEMKWMQETYYIPNNSILVVTGDVHADQVFALAQRLYGDWKAGPNPFIAHPLVTHPPLPASKPLLVTEPVADVSLRLDWQGPSTGLDLKGAIVADVFNTAAGLDGSRLQRALVDSGLASSASINYSTLKNTGQITLSIDTTPDKALDAARAALREVSHFADADYLTDAQWHSAQTQLAVHDLYDRERASEFAHTLTYWFAVSKLGTYVDYIPTVRRLTRAVGAEYARRYLVGQPLVLSAMASPQAQQKYGISEKSLQALLDDRHAAAPAPHKHGRRGRIAASGDSTPDVQQFAVDTVPVVLRTNTASPVVAVSTYVRGGSLNLTPQNDGIEQCAIATAAYGGTRHLSRIERSSRLDALGTDVEYECVADYSRIDLKCVKDFFAPSFQLYADGITQPAFADADVDLVKRVQLSTIAQNAEDADQELRRISELFLFRGHPYTLRPIGTQATVSQLTPAELADYYKKLMTRSRLVIVAVGNIDRAHLEPALHAMLDPLPQGSPFTAAPPPLTQRSSDLYTEERALPTTYVRGMLPALPSTDPMYPAQYLTSQILSDKLFEEVRTRRNLSYSVGAATSDRRTNYKLLQFSSTRPNEAVKVTKDTIADLADHPLTQKELDGYVASFVTNYYLGIETSADQADALGHAQVVDGDWRRAFDLVTAVRHVTPAQVQEQARRYLDGIQWAVLGNTRDLDRRAFLEPPSK